MLVVRPNPRRMKYMRDSPSEIPDSVRGFRLIHRVRWERVLLVAAIAVAGIAALVAHFGW
jgi:hypothetical protein